MKWIHTNDGEFSVKLAFGITENIAPLTGSILIDTENISMNSNEVHHITVGWNKRNDHFAWVVYISKLDKRKGSFVEGNLHENSTEEIVDIKIGACSGMAI